MFLVFDTETTGFFQDKLPVDHSDQPHIVQLAAELCHDGGEPLAGFSFVVDPGIASGVSIPEKASIVHGITNETAAQFGVPLELALGAFSHLYQRADLIVGHNVNFDKNVVETAIARQHKSIRRLKKPTFCTMEAASPIMNMSPTERMVAAGISKPKPPKLEEAMRYFFDEGLDGAHDAMVDVIACRRLYVLINKLGIAK